MSIYPTGYTTIDIDMDLDNFIYDNIITDCTLNNINVTLPATLYSGYTFNFLKLDTSANTLTLTANIGGSTINGTTSYITSGKVYIEIISYNNDWKVLSFNLN